tara:strand:+ start:282 stop:917 length:636 start_codon:yes stop_codon:yes gene_type:complete
MARLASAFYNSDGTSGLLNKDAIQCYHLVDILWDDGSLTDLFLTDHIHTINYQSITQGSAKDYDPLGVLIGLTSISEATGIRTGGLTVTVAGVDPELASKILTSTQVINKRVVIYRGFFETAYVAPNSNNTYMLYDGTIKDFSLEEGGESAKFSIGVSSHWADFEKKTGRFTNRASQNTTKQYNSTSKFENDKGFDYASAMLGDIQWGPSN